MYWSDQVYAIHDVPPGTPVSVENGIQYYAPEGSRRAGVRHAGAFGHGGPGPAGRGDPEPLYQCSPRHARRRPRPHGNGPDGNGPGNGATWISSSPMWSCPAGWD